MMSQTNPPPGGLRERLAQDRIVIAPGVYDALTASLAEAAGFEALYLSGAAIAYTRLGRPDIGLVSMSEVAETARAWSASGSPRPSSSTPTPATATRSTCSAPCGCSSAPARAPSSSRTRAFPSAAATSPTRALVPPARWPARSARPSMPARSDDTLIIARTDAVAVEGFDAAIERAGLYAEAGADVLFVEAPRTSATARRHRRRARRHARR